LEDWLPFTFSDNSVFLAEFGEMFEVVIQLGAILAVVILFWSRLWPFSPKQSKEEKRGIWSMWLKVVVASIPAAFVGIIVDKILDHLTGKDIDGWLYNPVVVAIALIVYGIAFLVIESLHRGKTAKVQSIGEISYGKAIGIGLFQALSIVPGTSRSGSTILGSMSLGLSRMTAAEFSFFMAVPAMVGASGIKVLGFAKYLGESGTSVPAAAWFVLAIGCAVSFGISLLAIRFLMDFVRKHSFSPFGFYRIALGILVLIFWFVRF